MIERCIRRTGPEEDWRGRRVQGMETGELGPVRFIAVLSLMYEADLGLTG